ncbi:MAG: YjdF family protein [Eubacteriales bacterium]|nr:YjdF family protein [Eubacteriales bacterium]
MGEEQCKLTVFFDEPFWIGVFERIEKEKLSVAKITFGAEPKDYEVYAFILKHYYDLRFSSAVVAVVKESKQNPKRIQRDIKKSLAKNGIGTKSQQALKLQQEQNKQERRVKSREQKLAEAERLFELRQQKKKEKHRGR